MEEASVEKIKTENVRLLIVIRAYLKFKAFTDLLRAWSILEWNSI